MDGASSGNPGNAGVGIVIKTPERVVKISKCIGLSTNNEAEYTALLLALEWLDKNNVPLAIIHSDSKLVVNQINGIYKIKSKKLAEYAKKIKKFMSKKNIQLKWIEREKNKEADQLAKLGSRKC